MFRVPRPSTTGLLRSLFVILVCASLMGAPQLAYSSLRVKAASNGPIAVKTQRITKPHKQGEMLIKFKYGTPSAVREQILGAFSKEKKELKGGRDVAKLKIKDGFDLETSIGNIKQFRESIAWAEPNYLVTRESVTTQAVTPNDPMYGQQWALRNTGQNGGVPGADIGAGGGWETETGKIETVIAVIDTGVDLSHPDLASNLWENKAEAKGKKNADDDGDGYVDDVNGWNFVNDSSDVTDDHGHGTAAESD